MLLTLVHYHFLHFYLINNVTILFDICHFLLVVLLNPASISFLLVVLWNPASISNGFRHICIQLHPGKDHYLLGSRDVIGHVAI